MPLYFFLSPNIQQTQIFAQINRRYQSLPDVNQLLTSVTLLPRRSVTGAVPGSRGVTGPVPSQDPGV